MQKRARNIVAGAATIGPLAYGAFVKFDMWVGHLTFWDNFKEKALPIWRETILPMLTTERLAWICFVGGIVSLVWINFGERISAFVRRSLFGDVEPGNAPPPVESIAALSHDTVSPSAPPPVIERESDADRQKKQILIEFIVDAALPAFRQQKALQDQILGVIVNNGAVNSFVKQGLRYSPGTEDYFDAMEFLDKEARAGRIQHMSTAALIKNALKFIDKYSVLASFSYEFLRNASREEIAHRYTQSALAQWKATHDKLIGCYDVLRRDIALGDLYRPAENLFDKPLALAGLIGQSASD